MKTQTIVAFSLAVVALVGALATSNLGYKTDTVITTPETARATTQQVSSDAAIASEAALSATSSSKLEASSTEPSAKQEKESPDDNPLYQEQTEAKSNTLFED